MHHLKRRRMRHLKRRRMRHLKRRRMRHLKRRRIRHLKSPGLPWPGDSPALAEEEGEACLEQRIRERKGASTVMK
jgi:hypothetical protein